MCNWKLVHITIIQNIYNRMQSHTAFTRKPSGFPGPDIPIT